MRFQHLKTKLLHRNSLERVIDWSFMNDYSDRVNQLLFLAASGNKHVVSMSEIELRKPFLSLKKRLLHCSIRQAVFNLPFQVRDYGLLLGSYVYTVALRSHSY